MDKQTDNLTFSKLSSPGRDRVRGAQFPADERTGGRRERARGETGEGTDDRSVETGGGVGRTDGRTRVDRFLDLDLDWVALTPLRRRRRHVSSIERADKTGAGL